MGQDVRELLWGDAARPPRGRPAGLSREQIVAEAIAIADAEGLQKVSMKRVAERLDCGVMSLYRHVDGKEQLVALMHDTAIGPAPDLSADRGWREAVAEWARATRAYFLAHPWALPLVTEDRPVGPNEVSWLDQGLGALESTRLSGAERLAAVMVVNGFVRGGVQPEVQESYAGAQWFDFMADPRARERFPNTSALFADGSMSYETPELSFEFGLQVVLDGLERRIGDAA
ncbi:TetR/AcrR family transcriptional regulator [Glycomyces arizonensis]|uniref:TetR/AcrR family transcriptional regulator n=1 Tax=Glycomyces arizonensis TaxID=256035 RepID=UPI000403EA4B|nr:TetR/AcrR family transcriptional regulator C-terminal domain-containing protein [Glycomyces arizonensis]